jgi:hypothetical protein
MGIFSNILAKLGIKPAAANAAAPVHITAESIAAAHADTVANAAAKQAVASAAAAAAAQSAAIPVVDVVSKLEQMAKMNPEKLDWKVSIVDMLKLLGMDSSLAARKELATELACPAAKMGGDYSEMNIWLHQTVLQKIADNGGNIPASLLK